MEWLKGNQIKVKPPGNPKRITGTRLASILGLDRWNTEFKTWCAVTRTYEEPFVDNKYTIAGKTIEPKIIDYLNKVYFFGNLKSPEYIYGKDYFKKTWGNFFPNIDTFGGMWDAILVTDGKVTAIIEIKTTKRVEDWQDGAPEYYALQAALYAYLKGVDEVVMVCGFLEEKDYENPEGFIPSTSNVIIDDFLVSERFPQFKRHIERARKWWEDHVVTGISPAYDEKKDEDILKELRKNIIETEDDITEKIKLAEKLKDKLEKVKSDIKEDEKTLKETVDSIKTYCMDKFRDGDTKVSIPGKKYEFILSKSIGSELDKKALEKDGLLEKYTKGKISYRFTQTKIKKEEGV